MRCPKCNSIIENGTLFCTECGCNLQEYQMNKNAQSKSKNKLKEKKRITGKSIKRKREKISIALIGSFWAICLLLFATGAACLYLI